jgi:hypothetical protein
MVRKMKKIIDIDVTPCNKVFIGSKLLLMEKRIKIRSWSPTQNPRAVHLQIDS